jgi:AAA+ ATPase superfamily predicted ATPase
MLGCIMSEGIIMADRFVDRVEELEALELRYRGDKPELVIVYGRRRVGKTALLVRFCKGKKALVFVAARVREKQNLDALRDCMRADLDVPLLEHAELESWGKALDVLAEVAGKQRIVVVLDEFQYACEQTPALPSLLQRWWDDKGKKTRLMLILCGSHVGFMEGEVLAERSPLFGRRTGQRRLLPLLPWHTRPFFRRRNPAERLQGLSIVGGMPAYLERIRPADSLRSFLLREVFSSDGYLFEEVPFLLRTELGQAHTFMSLLRVMAAGNTRISEIAQKAGMPVTSATRPLAVLGEMGLVTRAVPFGEKHPERCKQGRYAISDPFTRFWCRYVLPHQAMVVAGQGRALLDDIVLPDLPNVAGPHFESVCEQFVRFRAGEILDGISCLRTGRLWGRDFDIDVAADLSDGSLLLAECKAWGTRVGVNVLRQLEERAGPFSAARKVRLALFSMGGFTAELRRATVGAEVILVDGKQIL